MFRRIVLFLLCSVIVTSCKPDPRRIAPHPQEESATQAAPTETMTADLSSGARSAAHMELCRRIEEAKRLLGPAQMHTSRIGGNDAVLAVWNPALAAPPTLVVVANGLSRTNGFDITVRRANGVNSNYRVNAPVGYITLAIKTNVRGATPPFGPTAVVYVPYSEDLHRKELTHDGLEYLHGLVPKAADALDEKNVRSLIDPNSKVSETVPAKILTTLLVIEHIDPDEFAALGTEHSVSKVLMVLGANRGDAFRYAVSGAHARGLAQFIPSTYDITRNRYPSAGLPKSFVEGMTNHQFAVMAQYCLADWSLTKLPAHVLRTLQASDRQENLGAWLAAAYNGGEERAARVYLGDPAHWEEAGHGLAPETVKYVVIFRAVFRQLYP